MVSGQLIPGAVNAAGLKSPYPLFDHYANVGNVGTGEDDLYSDSIAAGQLAANGDKLHAVYSGTWVGHATATRELRVYFGGSLVFDSTAYSSTVGGPFNAALDVIRVSASVVRVASAVMLPSYTALGNLPINFSDSVEVTSLTLANAQILKITGEAASTGAATNDIVARLASVVFVPAA